jgi:chitin synthase
MSSYTIYQDDRLVKTERQHTVKSQAGNFVVHLPVSDHILRYANHKTGDEFTHCTYTAVTRYRNGEINEIDTFPRRYQLRARIFGREIKIAIVITMYNEDEELFIKTMNAVQANIAYLCDSRCSFGFGKEGWKKIVVVIVADGRAKVNPRTLTAMETMGIYFDKVARTTVDNIPVEAHIYEFTSQVGLDRKYQMLHSTDGIVPTQTIFVLKEENAKKVC